MQTTSTPGISLARLAQTLAAPEHHTFCLPGGPPGALLIHGFPGTPAEMQALGQVLHQAGWTVHGLLLPGLGPHIETLFEQRREDWLAAVQDALRTLCSQHQPALVCGFSMGGALALQAAAAQPPDGVILLAPFIKVAHALWGLTPLLRLLLPTLRPFRLVKVDFSDPMLRKEINRFLPNLDLDDPHTQQALRDLPIPTALLDEVRKVGQAAWQAAPALHAPALVLQGTRDGLVRPHLTRQLVGRLPKPPAYSELPAAHDLPDPSRLAWPQVKHEVLQFAEQLK